MNLPDGSSQLLRGYEVGILKIAPDLDGDLKTIDSLLDQITVGMCASLDAQYSTALNEILDLSKEKAIKALSTYAGLLATFQGTMEGLEVGFHRYFLERATASTRSNIDAKFKVCDLPLDRYLVYARYNTSLTDGYWLDTVASTQDPESSVELTNYNLNDLSSFFDFNTVKAYQKKLLEADGLYRQAFGISYIEVIEKLSGEARQTAKDACAKISLPPTPGP